MLCVLLPQLIRNGKPLSTSLLSLSLCRAQDVDWRDRRHWGCNDQVHPSRHGTYDGIAFHPYETVSQMWL